MKPSEFLVLPGREEVAKDVVKDLPTLVSTKIAAEVLGIHLRTLQRWIRDEKLRVLRTARGRAGKCMVPRSELLRLIASMVR